MTPPRVAPARPIFAPLSRTSTASDSLIDLLRSQVSAMEDEVQSDFTLAPCVRFDLADLFERAARDLDSLAPSSLSGLAAWVHELGFRIYAALGATLQPPWLRRWILVDLEIEAHLRLHRLGPAIDQIYGRASA